MEINYSFKPRGIGKNSLECFMCSCDEPKHDNDMACFVENKIEGEEIVKLFEKYGFKVWLDYRPNEPNWVQVKLGCCDKHLSYLKILNLLVKSNRYPMTDIPRISDSIVEIFKSYIQ